MKGDARSLDCSSYALGCHKVWGLGFGVGDLQCKCSGRSVSTRKEMSRIIYMYIHIRVHIYICIHTYTCVYIYICVASL